jgi:HlyD family secretion protein
MAKSGSSPVVKILFLVVATGALAAGAYYWTQRSSQPSELTTIPLGRGEITQTVTATGGLQATTSVDVSSQVSGLITEVAVDFNTPVKTGQVLARLDPATYQSRLTQAQAQLANMQANFTLTRLNTERTRELHTKALVSQQDLDQAEAQLTQAQAQLQIQTATVGSAEVDLGRCTICAPMDGIVLDRQAEKGRTVAASLNAPTLFTIIDDLANMEIDAAVAEADIGNVDLKQNVTFTVDAYQGRTFRGAVSQIRNSPKTVSNVVTYSTIIGVSNADLKLKPGMTASVAIVVAQRRNALRLPNGTLRVRLPDAVLAARKLEEPAPATGTEGATPAKPMTEEEQRAARREIMSEAGFTRGGGAPSPEVLQKAQQLAKARGLDIDFGRSGGGERGAPGASTTRNVFVLVGSDPKTARIKQVSVKLGITDGIYTEVLDGLQEGDVLVTGIALPGGAAATTAAASSPFSQPRGPGGPGGRH